MITIKETVYPRFRNVISDEELYKLYTPSSEEISLAMQNTKKEIPKLCFLVMLKTFQRLGYFIFVKEVPEVILKHISKHLKISFKDDDIAKYDKSGTRKRHLLVIRDKFNVVYDSKKIRKLVVKTAFAASKTKDHDADIINVVIEELVRQSYELPGFSTLVRATRKVRARLYNSYYKLICYSLDEKTKLKIDSLFEVDKDTTSSKWIELKLDTGKPTVSNLKDMIQRFEQVQRMNIKLSVLKDLPDSKLKHFVDEAKSLDSWKMKELKTFKRYTLAVAFLKQRYSSMLDDMGEMFIKMVKKGLNVAKEKMELYKLNHSKITDELIETLNSVAKVYKEEEVSKEDKFDKIELLLNSNGRNIDSIIENCEKHSVYAGNNFFPFFWESIKGKRSTFFKLLSIIQLKSTNQDKSIEDAVTFIVNQKSKRSEYIDLDFEDKLNLSWIQENWWKLVTGYTNRNNYPTRIHRRNFEACVLYQIMWNLKSGDLCIADSDIYSDYREQLISWSEYEENISLFGQQVGLPTNKDDFVKLLKDQLDSISEKVDSSFPMNKYLKIEDGRPILSRLKKKDEPKDLRFIESLIADKLEPVNLIDILFDTDKWLNWTKHFKNISGLESKISNLTERSIVTSFCYGCNLGPAQIARSFEGYTRKHISWYNQRYVTEGNLSNSAKDIVNKYINFALPKFWGTGERASADGTMWDTYEQNLLSEYHIRYGGFGALGYYIVSDLYIALFSHFIPCGVWEGIYILDDAIKESLDVNPNILHYDTQGQSTTIFGLSHLLGIQLMPRIRNWKDLKFVKSNVNKEFVHIEELFTDTVDWKLIETHLPDMFRVALSIKMGKITPSTILRKLGTYSKKNKLYKAFRELGLVIRTTFLLKYISEIDLRRIIQEAQNKSESFNEFAKWLSFGNDEIAENNREQQRKIIKYNHLVANTVIFYNVFHMSVILQELASSGYEITEEILECLSPYIRPHINRFGKYSVDNNRQVPDLSYELQL